VEDLHKSYDGVVALAGVDLEIAPGEIVALLGPNGAGKTTLVSIVAGLRRPDSGRVLLDGVDILAHPRHARRRVGLVPQATGYYPTLTVSDNLRFFGELSGLRGRALAARISHTAQALGLLELSSRPARTLSGGEARRLHAAMTLMHMPPLLLLDELTAGVDVHTRARLLDVVKGLAHDGGAVCYSTHYLHEVERLAAAVVIIDNGRIAAQDSVQALISRYGQPMVELRFDGPAPVLSDRAGAEVTDTTLRITTTEPLAKAAADLIAQLGADAQRLRAVEMIQPSLESVFLELTGRRVVRGEGEAE
jgi:ABC-2 type transport system ATP-binding protein